MMHERKRKHHLGLDVEDDLHSSKKRVRYSVKSSDSDFVDHRGSQSSTW